MMAKLVKFSFLLAFMAFALVFSSCKDDSEGIEPDPDPKPEEITIVIDDNQTFVQSNFIKSFEQIMNYYVITGFDKFTHDIVNGKVMATYSNLSVHGKFGDKYVTSTHNYNDKNVITSSTVVNLENILNPEYWDEYVYEYDKEGYIIKMYDENDQDEEGENTYNEYGYNEKGLLTSKRWVREGGDYPQDELSTFEYDANDKLIKTYYNGNLEREYVYVGEKEFLEKHYDETDEGIYYVTKYLLNDDHILIKEIDDDGGWVDYVYFDEYFSHIEYYGDQRVRKKYNQSRIDELDETWFYSYDEDDKFEHCLYRLIEDEEVQGYKFYEGTVDNLLLIGYSIFSEDAQGREVKTFYNKDDKKVYEQKYDENSQSIRWFNSYGQVIPEYNEDQIEYWVEYVN